MRGRSGTFRDDLRKRLDIDQASLRKLLRWAQQRGEELCVAYDVTPAELFGCCKRDAPAEARGVLAHALRTRWLQSPYEGQRCPVTFALRRTAEDESRDGIAVDDIAAAGDGLPPGKGVWRTLSYPVIGYILGRHHSAVICMLRRYERRRMTRQLTAAQAAARTNNERTTSQ